MTASDIARVAAQLGLAPLPPGAAEKFETYLSLLLKWNARLNLTAIRDPEMIVRRQFLECIFLAQQLPENTATLLDFGSGGGFPGLPIAICRPDVQVTLAESQGKKASFLREAVRVLHVDAAVYDKRVETLAESFDAVALRAVDKMQEACKTAALRVKQGGRLLLFATESTEKELLNMPGDWKWAAPISVLGSVRSFLLFGQKERNVPRGTNSLDS